MSNPTLTVFINLLVTLLLSVRVVFGRLYEVTVTNVRSSTFGSQVATPVLRLSCSCLDSPVDTTTLGLLVTLLCGEEIVEPVTVLCRRCVRLTSSCRQADRSSYVL